VTAVNTDRREPLRSGEYDIDVTPQSDAEELALREIAGGKNTGPRR
jgi:hypothetical protein